MKNTSIKMQFSLSYLSIVDFDYINTHEQIGALATEINIYKCTFLFEIFFKYYISLYAVTCYFKN